MATDSAPAPPTVPDGAVATLSAEDVRLRTMALQDILVDDGHALTKMQRRLADMTDGAYDVEGASDSANSARRTSVLQSARTTLASMETRHAAAIPYRTAPPAAD